ncbi:MAG: hypothetical protein DMNBKLKJ_00199 [Candidatus Westeberhardia cardiocondylae]|nr:hypothetical protein [Candidatus Westeberhardia cardiocondylae]
MLNGNNFCNIIKSYKFIKIFSYIFAVLCYGYYVLYLNLRKSYSIYLLLRYFSASKAAIQPVPAAVMA